MTIPAKGDVEIVVAGRHLVLRPSFEAICAVEAATGKAALVLLAELNERRMRTTDQVAILYLAHKESGAEPKLTHAEVGALVLQAGYGALLAHLNGFLGKVVEGVGAPENPPGPGAGG